MNQFPIDQLPARAAGTAQALLGARQGYRFAGDTIHPRLRGAVRSARSLRATISWG